MKRTLDLLVAAIALTILSPLLVVAAAIVRVTMGAPVLFRQARPGYRGRPFVPYKFRTMHEATDIDGRILPDTERLIAVGRILRHASIDELPQFLNVLRGEMSVVGPRPLLTQYLDRYPPQYARRHDVKPGITGWAQVNGRDELPFGKRLELDVWYVDHQSTRLDLKIMCLTVLTILGRHGNKVCQDEDEILAIDDVNLTDLSRAVRGPDPL